MHDLSLNPASIYIALIKAGVIREVGYLSTTGSGEEKYFREISPDYMDFGINRKTMHEFRTEPRFYVDRFFIVLGFAVKQIQDELDQVTRLNT